MTIRGYEDLGNVRLVDLVAKTAKASIKDTIRVVMALRLLERVFDIQLEDVAPDVIVFDTSRASPEHVAACEQAYSMLEKKCEEEGYGVLRAIPLYK